MTTLEDAWEWYRATYRHLRRSERLARLYWNDLPWDGSLGRDESFRDLRGQEVESEAAVALSYLQDLAIVVLFSVFEAEVRGHILAEVKREAELLRHRTLIAAAADTLERIAEGSFFHILQPFKDADADLVEQVNQVRRYRNWVAHGRQNQPTERVTPELAYERLSRFLAVMRMPSGVPASEEPAPP